jgi:hypothetical protein
MLPNDFADFEGNRDGNHTNRILPIDDRRRELGIFAQHAQGFFVQKFVRRFHNLHAKWRAVAPDKHTHHHLAFDFQVDRRFRILDRLLNCGDSAFNRDFFFGGDVQRGFFFDC